MSKLAIKDHRIIKDGKIPVEAGQVRTDEYNNVVLIASINNELCYTHLHGGFNSFIRSQEYIEKEFPILLDVELVIK